MTPPIPRADRIHERATEAAMALDRGYAARHPDVPGYVRAALAHELCPPGGPCWTVETVAVAFVAPGSRMRFPMAATRERAA